MRRLLPVRVRRMAQGHKDPYRQNEIHVQVGFTRHTPQAGPRIGSPRFRSEPLAMPLFNHAPALDIDPRPIQATSALHSSHTDRVLTSAGSVLAASTRLRIGSLS